MPSDYIERKAALDALSRGEGCGNVCSRAIERLPGFKNVLPPVDCVSREAFDQVLWENDILRRQLQEIGKHFGEQMEDVVHVIRCENCDHYYYADNRVPEERDWVCAISGKPKNKDDFCSRAIPKEEEDA